MIIMGRTGRTNLGNGHASNSALPIEFPTDLSTESQRLGEPSRGRQMSILVSLTIRFIFFKHKMKINFDMIFQFQ